MGLKGNTTTASQPLGNCADEITCDKPAIYAIMPSNTVLTLLQASSSLSPTLEDPVFNSGNYARLTLLYGVADGNLIRVQQNQLMDLEIAAASCAGNLGNDLSKTVWDIRSIVRRDPNSTSRFLGSVHTMGQTVTSQVVSSTDVDTIGCCKAQVTLMAGNPSGRAFIDGLEVVGWNGAGDGPFICLKVVSGCAC